MITYRIYPIDDGYGYAVLVDGDEVLHKEFAGESGWTPMTEAEAIAEAETAVAAWPEPEPEPEPPEPDPTIEEYLVELDYRVSMIELGLI